MSMCSAGAGLPAEGMAGGLGVGEWGEGRKGAQQATVAWHDEQASAKFPYSWPGILLKHRTYHVIPLLKTSR